MSDCINLFDKAQTLIPGGVNSPVRAFRSVGGTPVFFQRGAGPYLYDEHDRPFIDFIGSWGCLILGHAHPDVVHAVSLAVKNGLGFGTPTPIEVELAELITQLIPSIEQIRMVNSGTEATQTAIRLARGYTGRNKILKFEGCYHGHSDGLLVKAGSGLLTLGTPSSAGVPESYTQHTLVAPYNDIEAVNELFEIHGQDIAGIIVEPIAGNMNLVLPESDFLLTLRALCNDSGSCLIFDEVMTGFRVALGGAQSLFEIVPDLTCLGKIIGGGLPVGAVGGKREIMQCLSPQGPVYQAGTLSGNPIALQAGLTTLTHLMQPGFYEKLYQLSEYFLSELQKLAQASNIALQTQHVGSMFGIYFSPESPITRYEQIQQCSKEFYNRFFHGMLKQGVYFAPSAFEAGFISSTHTKPVLDEVLEKANTVFQHWI